MSPLHSASPRLCLSPWLYLLVIAAVLLAHGAALNSGWVLDDTAVVRTHPDVARGPEAIGDLFASGVLPGEMERGAWRPLVLASFALEAPLWRDAQTQALKPMGFHATNLALHVLACLLLLVLVHRLVPGMPAVAAGAAILHAIHPVHVGTVSALVGRADLLAVVFGLGALLAWVSWRTRGGVLALPVGLLCLLLALLSKETALAFLIAGIVIDRVLLRAGRVQAATAWGAALVLLPLAAFWVLWPGIPDGPLDVPGPGMFVAAGHALYAHARLCLRFLVPIALRGDHSDELDPVAGVQLGGLDQVVALLVGLAFLLTVFLWWRGRLRPGAGAWSLSVATALAAGLVTAPGLMLEDRFLYLAGLPLCALGGWLTHALLRGLPGALTPATRGVPGLVACLVAAGCLGGLARAEAAMWKDDRAFHEELLERRPQHILALLRQGRRDRHAAEEFRALAARVPAQDAAGRPTPQLTRIRQERAAALASAATWLERVRSEPAGRRDPETWIETGLLKMEAGAAAEALESFTMAQELDPLLSGRRGDDGGIAILGRATTAQRARAGALYYGMGRAHNALGQREETASAMRTASTFVPTEARYLQAAGNALCALRRWGEGLPLLEQAAIHAATHSDRKQIGELLKQQRVAAKQAAVQFYRTAETWYAEGNRRRAVEAYEKAIAAEPAQVEARVRAARLRGDYFGDYLRAERYLKSAEGILEQAGAAADDERWEQIRKWRAFLRKRKAEDDAEVVRDAHRDPASGDPDSQGPDSQGPDSQGPDSQGPDSQGPDSQEKEK